jgi:hypothetical protein
VLQQIYKKQLPISSAKKNDLLDLCRTGVIPSNCRGFFEALPASNTARDMAAEAAVDDSELDDNDDGDTV